MTTVTENDLKRVEDKIDRLSSETEKLVNQVSKLTDVVNNLAIGQAELKGEIKALEENVNGQIKALEENVNGKITTLTETIKGIDKRLDNTEVLNRIVSGGIVIGIVSALIKYLFFSNPPL